MSHNRRHTFNLLHLYSILLICTLSACKVDKFLGDNQYIVESNRLKLNDVKDRRTKAALALEIPTLYRQRDLNIFFLGRYKAGAYYYFKSQDTTVSRTRRRIRRELSSRVVSFYDPQLTKSTERNIKQYLQNIGYWYPSVSSTINNHNRDKGFIDVTYYVSVGQRYVIDTVQFVCADTAVQYALNDISEDSYLHSGAPLDSRLYEQEKIRITDSLNNFGFARFGPNFIMPLDGGDTSEIRLDAQGNRLVNIILTVQTPNNQPKHPRFITGQVQVFPQYDARFGEQTDSATVIGLHTYYTKDGNLGLNNIDPLSKAIPIHPFSDYRKADADKAFRQLTNLGIYRAVNVRPLVDECDSNAITYRVYLTPNKRRTFEAGLEANYSNIASIASSDDPQKTTSKLGRVGIAADFGYLDRNFRLRAEKLSLSASAGLDYGLQSRAQNGFTGDIRTDATWSLPRFADLSKSWWVLNKIRVVRKSFYNELKDNATTDFSANYNFSDRLSLKIFRLQQINFNLKYVLRRKNGAERWIFNQTGLEFQLSKLDTGFEKRIENNQRFINSLQSQLMTGALFRSMVWERKGRTNEYGESFTFIGSVEQSGTELWAGEQLFNDKKALQLGGLKFAKYWRSELDVRYSREFAPKRAFGARFSAGLAAPFSAQPVPYSRQFFVGGPNSIRGWVARNLGPGRRREDKSATIIPFQAGDVKLEFNSEYRFPVFWRIESAIFLDFGNIWNINSDRIEENFGKFFYDQIGISSGVGLRMDLTYAYVRVDFGYRLRNPYPYSETVQSRWIPIKNWGWDKMNPNFALGLPF